jgi:Kef-type K+ transport system membrane component KefB
LTPPERTLISGIADFVRHYVLNLSALGRFGLTLVMLVFIPRLCRRAHVPTAVALLLSGVIVGPYVLGFFGTDLPIADFLAELGKLLLMFFAGLEIDLALFRRARKRSVTFGLVTTTMPLLLGTAFGLAFGFATIPAIVIGSLLASHTLLGLPVIDRLGMHRLRQRLGKARGHGACRPHPSGRRVTPRPRPQMSFSTSP